MKSVALFVAWAVVGLIGSFALLYGFTPVGPLILLLIWLAYRFLPKLAGSRSPEALGAALGFGVSCLFLATAVDDNTGLSWAMAAVGAALATGSAGAYVANGRRRCRASVAAT